MRFVDVGTPGHDPEPLRHTRQEQAARKRHEHLLYGLRQGEELYGYVDRVIDGDTLEMDLAGKAKEVRLIGVDTPETVDPDRPIQRY